MKLFKVFTVDFSLFVFIIYLHMSDSRIPANYQLMAPTVHDQYEKEGIPFGECYEDLLRSRNIKCSVNCKLQIANAEVQIGGATKVL